MNKKPMTKAGLEKLLVKIKNALDSSTADASSTDSKEGGASPDKKGGKVEKERCFDALNNIKGHAMLLVEEDEFNIRVPEGSIDDDDYVEKCNYAQLKEWIDAIDADICSFIRDIRSSERVDKIITKKNKETQKYVRCKNVGFVLLIISLIAGMLIPVVMALTDWAPFKDGENQFGELVSCLDGVLGVVGLVLELISDRKKSNIDAKADRDLIGRT